ncbi:MAG: tRNA (adenosine(37)-N6)-dimethylallyltransferase MiaA [Clostridia bacterium]|nr:tRNA (adenosine(37)-N6)-dimethylallyltransferase MiaA [Clostridia bacterium]
MKKQKIVVVAGPTGTGKTRLSVALAKQFGGEVISADSMQIYKGLDIGSAKVTPEETEGIPHHLIDILAPDETFSVAQYVQKANEAAEDILERGKLPILCGGTGLYISSFVDNVKFTESQTDFSLRERLMSEAEEKGTEVLWQRLAELDPKAAEAVHPNNVKRVVRALELYESTGLTLSEQNARSKLIESPYEPVMLALTGERELLYERINLRVDRMVAAGLFEEVKALSDSGMTRSMQSMQGIGYKEVLSCFEGECELSECIELIKKNSRNYAKRQLTWFKRDERYQWFDISEENFLERAMAYVQERIR